MFGIYLSFILCAKPKVECFFGCYFFILIIASNSEIKTAITGNNYECKDSLYNNKQAVRRDGNLLLNHFFYLYIEYQFTLAYALPSGILRS